jgi:hypothetical protein
MFTIYASMAQQESENLSQDIKWGIHHAFKTGTSKLIARPCYGYRQSIKQNENGEENNTLVIYEPEAVIVRQIFKWNGEGCSLRQISKLLKEQSISTPTDKPTWGTETLNKLLHNEKYTGNVLLQKTYVPDMLEAKQVKNDKKVDAYYIENTHEAIVKSANNPINIR